MDLDLHAESEYDEYTESIDLNGSFERSIWFEVNAFIPL